MYYKSITAANVYNIGHDFIHMMEYGLGVIIMTIKCIECNLHWNVSIKKNIDPKGYICPRCKQLNNEEEANQIWK
ncbi:hypothetical protein CLPUN_13290 [Clostridium puniceum]|uniref:Uncharacterized protein n=1 Tax=Clostridium puniceum TaxID=29367 RepID=A0A1S8TS04_9CLOT|nr:hypothetical protein CLPUN_13290 [Clostridium puniceum]